MYGKIYPCEIHSISSSPCSVHSFSSTAILIVFLYLPGNFLLFYLHGNCHHYDIARFQMIRSAPLTGGRFGFSKLVMQLRRLPFPTNFKRLVFSPEAPVCQGGNLPSLSTGWLWDLGDDQNILNFRLPQIVSWFMVAYVSPSIRGAEN